MNKEIPLIEKNNTWELTTLLVGKKLKCVKQIYKIKYKHNGKVVQFKVRLVAKGYKQKSGIDYFDVIALLVRLYTICMIIALTVQKKKWENSLNKYEVGFLNGILEEEVFLKQPLEQIKEKRNKFINSKKCYVG